MVVQLFHTSAPQGKKSAFLCFVSVQVQVICALPLVLIWQCGVITWGHERFLSRCFTGDLFNLCVNKLPLPTSSSPKLGLFPCFIIHPHSFTVANSNPATQRSLLHYLFRSRLPSVCSACRLGVKRLREDIKLSQVLFRFSHFCIVLAQKAFSIKAERYSYKKFMWVHATHLHASGAVRNVKRGQVKADKQRMRLNKKREQTQGGFEEQLMRELKWMTFADATDLTIYAEHEKQQECPHEVISTAPEENLLTVWAMLPRFLIRSFILSKAVNEDLCMILFMCFLIHRSEKRQWVFDNMQMNMESSPHIPHLLGGIMNQDTMFWDSSVRHEMQFIKFGLTGTLTQTKHLYRRHLEALANLHMVVSAGTTTVVDLPSAKVSVVVQSPSLFKCADFTSTKCPFYRVMQ